MKFKIYDTKNKLVKSALFFLATLMMLSFNPLTVVASNNDSEKPIYIDLAELGFTDIYLDIPEYYLEHLDIEYLEQNISFISEYEFLELQADKIILEQIVLDDDHTLILLYEYEDGYVDIVARVVITKLVAIATFTKWKNPTVITRLAPFVSSNAMRAVTNTRAGQLRSALRPFSSFTSSQAMQDTVFRAMVSSGVSPSDARAIGVGVVNVVRWSR